MNRFLSYTPRSALLQTIRAMSGKSSQMGDLGAGAGKGGGAGGSIREAGGAFGKMEAAREEEYFYKMQRKQLDQLKTGLDQEIEFHEQQIKAHQEAIRRQKERIDDLAKSEK